MFGIGPMHIYTSLVKKANTMISKNATLSPGTPVYENMDVHILSILVTSAYQHKDGKRTGKSISEIYIYEILTFIILNVW
jgi:hypothetical protein